MSFAARQHTAAAAGGSFLPLGTMSLFGESFNNIGTTDTATVTFNTDGTITGVASDFETPGVTLPSNWYSPTTGAIGAGYQIRFTLQSGTTWNAGLVSGTLYALSSARALAWSVVYSDPGPMITATVLVEILTTGGDPYKSGTLTVNLYNGEA